MSDWGKVRFDQLASPDRWAFSIGPFGSKVTASDYREDGVPFIRGVNLAKGVFLDDGFVFISDQKAKEIESALVEPGDIVFTRKGTVGQVSMIPRNPRYDKYAISGSQVKARIDERCAMPEFYYYWFRSPVGQHSILEHAVTTGVPSLANSLQSIRGLMVPNPPLFDQSAVVNVLSALDDKIGVNERIAAVCSQLSRSHMEAMWAASPVGSLTSAPPSPMGDWKFTTLSELCGAGNGSIQTGPFGSQLHASDYVTAGVPSVMPQNIGDNTISEDGIARISEGDAARLSKYLLRQGDIVYSRRGDVRRRALIRSRESGWLCGTGCLRVRPGGSADPLFISHYLGEPEVQEWITRHAVGATMPNLNTQILGSVPVVLPPGDVRDKINNVLSVLDGRFTVAIRESHALATLRDTLLPQLMSGRLRVKDAEKIVEDHT